MQLDHSPSIFMLGTKYLILMCVAMRVRIEAMPNGAPEQACETLIPQHGDAKPSNTDAPYTVKVQEADSAKKTFQHILLIFLNSRSMQLLFFPETRLT